jgi:hypothetical protein
MQPPDPLTAILFRLTGVEENVKELQTKLNFYVPERENDLKLKNILDSLTHIGGNLQEVKDAYKELSNKLIEQQDNQNKVQIRVLLGAISTVVTALGGVLVGYITHFFR